MFSVSAAVLLVPMFTVSPAVPVAMFTVLALLPVPRLTAPVVPESRVMAEEVVEDIVPVPAKVKAVALVAMVSIEATPVRAPPEVTFRPVEARENVSSVSPMVMVSASALLARVKVSQFIELQTETEVAVVLPKVKAPAEITSSPCPAATASAPALVIVTRSVPALVSNTARLLVCVALP